MTMEDPWDINTVLSPTRSGKDSENQPGSGVAEEHLERDGCEDASEDTIAAESQPHQNSENSKRPSGCQEPEFPNRKVNGNLTHPCYTKFPSTGNALPSPSAPQNPLVGSSGSRESTKKDSADQPSLPLCFNKFLGCIGAPLFFDISKFINAQNTIFDRSMVDVHSAQMMEIPLLGINLPHTFSLKISTPPAMEIQKQAVVATSAADNGGGSTSLQPDGTQPLGNQSNINRQDECIGATAVSSRVSAEMPHEVGGRGSSKARPKIQISGSLSMLGLQHEVRKSPQGVTRRNNLAQPEHQNREAEFPGFQSNSHSSLQSRLQTSSDAACTAVKSSKRHFSIPVRDPRIVPQNSAPHQIGGGRPAARFTCSEDKVYTLRTEAQICNSYHIIILVDSNCACAFENAG